MNFPLPRVTTMLATLLLVVGCQTRSENDTDAAADTAPPPNRAGTRLQALPVETDWTLVESNASGLSRAEANAIRLHVSHNRLSGDSGCNQFSAGYHISESKLSVGMPAATKRGCPGAVGEVEQALFALLPELSEAASFEDQLILRDGRGRELRFAPAAAAPKPAGE